jgi:hypothetical protein
MLGAIGSIAGSVLGGIGGSFFGPLGGKIGASLGGSLGSQLGGGSGFGSRAPGAPGSDAFGGPAYTFQQYQREKTLPDWLQQPSKDTVSAIMDAGTREFNPYEYQFRPELFSPDELTAQGMYREVPGRYLPGITTGLDVVDAAQNMALYGPRQDLLDAYKNPHLSGIMDVQNARSLEDFQRRQRETQRLAGQIGSYGGSRMGIRQAQEYDDFRERQDFMEQAMLSAAHDKAMAGMERGLDRGLATATGALQGLHGVDLSGIRALEGSGERQYMRDFGEFMRKEADPMLKAGFLSRNMQPWAATMQGEKGTSLGYTDSNSGTIGKGLGIASVLNKALDGDWGQLGDLFGLGGGGDDASAGTSLAGAVDFSEGFPVGNLVSKAGDFGNTITNAIFANEGGVLDPYDIYTTAAQSGASYINPPGFSGWITDPFSASDDPVATGGLAGAIEKAVNKKDEEEKKVSEKGEKESEGKTTPGPESEDTIFEKLIEWAKGDDVSEGEDDSGIAEVLTNNRGGLLAFNDGGLTYTLSPVNPAKDDSKKEEEKKKADPVEELMQEKSKGLIGNLVDPQYHIQRYKDAPIRSGLHDAGLAATAYGIGVPKAIGWGVTKGIPGLLGLAAKHPKIAASIGGAGLTAGTKLGGPEELAKPTEEKVEEKVKEEIKKEAKQDAKEMKDAASKKTLTLGSGYKMPSRDELYKSLRENLQSTKDKEDLFNSQMLKWGSIMATGGGDFAQNLVTATLAADEYGRAQLTAEREAKMKEAEMVEKMYQKDINALTQETLAKKQELEALYMPYKYQTERMKAEAQVAEAMAERDPLNQIAKLSKAYSESDQFGRNKELAAQLQYLISSYINGGGSPKDVETAIEKGKEDSIITGIKKIK